MARINKKILWITQTAIFIALLIALQAVTAPLGQLVTGSCVNLILITAALTAGIWSGLTVALLSPIFAFLFGIGPQLIQIIPVIIIGNLIIVIVTWLISSKAIRKGNVMGFVQGYIGIILGAVAKFLVLWLGVTQVFIPLMGDALKPQQVTTFTAMFSTPQLITALIGGAVSIPLAFALNKILKRAE